MAKKAGLAAGCLPTYINNKGTRKRFGTIQELKQYVALEKYAEFANPGWDADTAVSDKLEIPKESLEKFREFLGKTATTVTVEPVKEENEERETAGDFAVSIPAPEIMEQLAAAKLARQLKKEQEEAAKNAAPADGTQQDDPDLDRLMGTSDVAPIEFDTKTMAAITSMMDAMGVGLEVGKFDRKDVLGAAKFLDGTIQLLGEDSRPTPEAWMKLPEEVSHWWFRLLNGNSDLKQALWRAIEQHSKVDELLNTEYGALVHKLMADKNSTKDSLESALTDLKEEAIGQVIAEAIKRIQDGKATKQELTFWQKLMKFVRGMLGMYQQEQETPFDIAAAKIIANDLEDLLTASEYTYMTARADQTALDAELNTSIRTSSGVEVSLDPVETYKNYLIEKKFKKSKYRQTTIDKWVKTNPGAFIKLKGTTSVALTFRGKVDIVKKYKQGVPLRSPIKLDNKNETILVEKVREMLLTENPEVRVMPAEDFIQEVEKFLTNYYDLQERVVGASNFASYRLAEIFEGKEPQSQNARHVRKGLYIAGNALRSLGLATHFSGEDPLVWQNTLTYLGSKTTNGERSKESLIHEIQSDFTDNPEFFNLLAAEIFSGEQGNFDREVAVEDLLKKDGLFSHLLAAIYDNNKDVTEAATEADVSASWAHIFGDLYTSGYTNQDGTIKTDNPYTETIAALDAAQEDVWKEVTTTNVINTIKAKFESGELSQFEEVIRTAIKNRGEYKKELASIEKEINDSWAVQYDGLTYTAEQRNEQDANRTKLNNKRTEIDQKIADNLTAPLATIIRAVKPLFDQKEFESVLSEVSMQLWRNLKGAFNYGHFVANLKNSPKGKSKAIARVTHLKSVAMHTRSKLARIEKLRGFSDSDVTQVINAIREKVLDARTQFVGNRYSKQQINLEEVSNYQKEIFTKYEEFFKSYRTVTLHSAIQQAIAGGSKQIWYAGGVATILTQSLGTGILSAALYAGPQEIIQGTRSKVDAVTNAIDTVLDTKITTLSDNYKTQQLLSAISRYKALKESINIETKEEDLKPAYRELLDILKALDIAATKMTEANRIIGLRGYNSFKANVFTNIYIRTGMFLEVGPLYTAMSNIKGVKMEYMPNEAIANDTPMYRLDLSGYTLQSPVLYGLKQTNLDNANKITLADVQQVLKNKTKEEVVQFNAEHSRLIENGIGMAGLFMSSMGHVTSSIATEEEFQSGFHGVFRSLLTKDARKSLLDSYKKSSIMPLESEINDLMATYSVSEKDANILFYESLVAEDFRLYQTSPSMFAGEKSNVKTNLFERLTTWTTFMTVPNAKEALMSQAVQNPYKDIPIDTLRPIIFNHNPLFLPEQEEDITRALSYILYDELGKDIENLVGRDIRDLIRPTLEKLSKYHKLKDFRENLNRVLENIDYFVPKIKEYFKLRGTIISEEEDEDGDGNTIHKSNVETSYIKSSSQKVRSFLALLQDKEYNKEESRLVSKKSSYLGTATLMNEAEVWHALTSTLSDLHIPATADGVEVMKKAMIAAKYRYPVFGEIIKELERSGNEQLKTLFFSTLDKTTVEYMSALISGYAGEFDIKFKTSRLGSQAEAIIKTWHESFINALSTAYKQDSRNTNRIYNIDRIVGKGKILDRYKKLITQLTKANARNLPTDSLIPDALALLESVGIVIEEKYFERMLRGIEPAKGLTAMAHFFSEQKTNSVGRLFTYLEKTLKGKGELEAVFLDIDKLPIVDQQSIKTAAKLYGELLPDLNETAYLGAKGNMYYAYSTKDLMTDRIAEWKANPDVLRSLVEGTAHWPARSRLGTWMLEGNNMDILSLRTLNSIRNTDRDDSGDKPSNLKESELLAIGINATLQDNKIATYTGLAEADKTRQIYIHGGKFEEANVQRDKDGIIRFKQPSKIIEIFLDYLHAEVSRMYLTQEQLDGRVPLERTVEFLHTQKKGLKSHLFPELNDVNEEGVSRLEELGLALNGKILPPTVETFKENTGLHKMIIESLRGAINADLKLFTQFGIITNEKGKYSNIGINVETLDRYEGDVTKAVADFTLNSIIGTIEVSKLFTGDPASFKENDKTGDLFADYLKRIPAITAAGLSPRIYGEVKPTYTSAVAADIKRPSSYFFEEAAIPYYEGNITPSADTIFVFGSNPEGRHGAGAAKIARTQFGAIYGQGEGLQGNSYALPTKDLRIKENNGFRSISEKDITANIAKLYKTAEQNKDKQFKIGYRNTTDTSLNGYTGIEMIEMFNAAGIAPSNVVFSKEWVDTGLITARQGMVLREDVVNATAEGLKKGIYKDSRKTLEEIKAAVRKSFSGYKSMKIADGQSWITLLLYKQRLKSYGYWNEAHDEAYERIEKGLANESDLSLFAQPLKTVHVEPVIFEGHYYLHYIKHSEVPLIPGITGVGTGLERLNEYMLKNGIDQVVTPSGKKSGASNQQNITDENGNILPVDQIKLDPVNLTTKYTRLQTEMPTKQVHSRLVASQVIKNIVSNIVLDVMYNNPFRGGESTGEELINDWHTLSGHLSDESIQSFMDEYGYNEETGELNETVLHKKLIKDLGDDLSGMERALLESGYPFEGILSLKRVVDNKKMALVRNKGVKLKQSGGSFIQVSEFGLIGHQYNVSDKVKGGIFWLKDVKEGLKPTRLEANRLVADKAQILLPHTEVINLLGEDYRKLSMAELREKLTPEILEGISYRIPNQDLSSTDAFEIVGILPPSAGDTIIAYSEIVAKTGSDFDIDKAFIILPNIERRDGKIMRPRRASEMTLEEAYQEKYLKDWAYSTRAKEIRKEESAEMETVKEQLQDLLISLKGSDPLIQAFQDRIAELEEATLANMSFSDVFDLTRKFTSGKISSRRLMVELKEANDIDKEIEKSKKMIRQLSAKNKVEQNKIYEELSKIDSLIATKVFNKLVLEGTIPGMPEFSTMSELEKSTRASKENIRIDMMAAMLTDAKSYGIAMAPLDSDSVLDIINNLHGDESEDARKNNLGFWRGSYQIISKTLFDKAKAMVGIVANHMTDHNVSQIDKIGPYVTLGKGNIDKKTGKTVYSAILDEDGELISRTLNEITTLIVDAVKDPAIIRANVNLSTAGVVFMMIRAGISREFVLSFIGQPILQEYVALQSSREGRVSEKLRENQLTVRPDLELLRKYANLAGVSASDMMDLKSDFSKVKTKELKKDVNGVHATFLEKREHYRRQIAVLNKFRELVESAKELNDVIKAAKADVDGGGKSYVTAELKELKLHKILQERRLSNLDKKFGAEYEDGETYPVRLTDDGFVYLNGTRMVGTYHRNTVQLALKMFADTSIATTQAAKNAVLTIAAIQNPALVDNEEAVEKLVDALYGYALTSKSSPLYMEDVERLYKGSNPKDPIPNTMARQLIQMRRKYPDNPLLNPLVLQPVISKSSNDVDLIHHTNIGKISKDVLQRAWADLFVTEPQFAKDLVSYAFYSSGASKSIKSFFHLVPPTYLANIGLGHFIKSFTKNLAEGSDTLPGLGAVIRHFATNRSIVPHVMNVHKTKLNTDVGIDSGFKIKAEHLHEYAIGNDAAMLPAAPRFMSDSTDNLYLLQGYSKDQDAIYRRTTKYGKDGVREMKYNSELYHTMFPENRVTLSKKTMDAVAKEVDASRPITAASSTLLDLLERKNTKSDKETLEVIKNCKIA